MLLLFRYCGPQVGKTILSEGSKIYIRFFTDSTIESRGFSIILEMYNTGCSKHFLNTDYGTFASPNYPGRYYADDICVWKIEVSNWINYLKLWFSNLNYAQQHTYIYTFTSH